MTNSLKIPCITEISEQRINDLFCNFFDSGVSNFWVERVRLIDPVSKKEFGFSTGKLEELFFQKLKDGWFFKIYIQDVAPHNLDFFALDEGLRKLALVHPDVFARILQENDDAGDADIFIQFCLFKEEIYG
jgi:hypothetical protein